MGVPSILLRSFMYSSKDAAALIGLRGSSLVTCSEDDDILLLWLRIVAFELDIVNILLWLIIFDFELGIVVRI